MEQTYKNFEIWILKRNKLSQFWQKIAKLHKVLSQKFLPLKY